MEIAAPRPSNQREESRTTECPTGLPAEKQNMILLHRSYFMPLPIVLLLFLALLPNACGAVPEAERSALIDFAQKTDYANWVDHSQWMVSAICFSLYFVLSSFALLSVFASACLESGEYHACIMCHRLLTIVYASFFLSFKSRAFTLSPSYS